jgi:C-terminal processing protease CtpA/Prc
MNRLFATVVALASLSFSQGPPELTQVQITKLLTFEDEQSGGLPAGWFGGPSGTIFADKEIVHGGTWSARLERSTASTQDFSTITKAIPITFSGSQIEFRGYLKTEDVSGFTGLWMREDGDTPGLAFDNMQKRGLNGTTGWTEYSITLPLHGDATQLFFGVLISGTGKTWADDLQILVDGKPMWEAPRRRERETVLSRDHDFDSGSKIAVTQLTRAQIENLSLLGRTWGFVKYHHPRVTAGEVHWDYELFRILPMVLGAESTSDAQKQIQQWITKLGPAPNCTECAKLKEEEIHLRPQLEWLSDHNLLGRELSDSLLAIHRNRPSVPKQFYVGQTPNVGNPAFRNEPAYAEIKLPDAGYQLLAVFRFWNIIEYWFPYRDVIGSDWRAVLREFIPRVTLARTRDSYQLELMALIARIHDTHANLWSSLKVRPPVGTCQVPVKLRFIGDRAVVYGYPDGFKAESSALRVGDVVESLDGVPVTKLAAEWAPYYAASNEPTRLRDIARSMTRGECVDAAMQVRRGKEAMSIKAPRLPESSLKLSGWHDQPGETFRKLSDDVGYLKLSSVKGDRAVSYIDAAAGTKGLIIDIRNYPSDFMVFALGSLLVDKPTPFARFTKGDLTNPGAFHFTQPITLEPAKPHYTGKVVILIDEVSQSSAEYTSMAFRASPRATVVGSTTAAADGNISPIPLPGGLRSMISGIGVFYPDKRPTQRVGILPDLEVKPTIEGISAGRDEVLERGVRSILGDSVPAAEIEKMARP